MLKRTAEAPSLFILKSICAAKNPNLSLIHIYISRKYLESIMTELSKNELVESAIGKTGGYKLKRAPENYKVDVYKRQGN